MKIENNITMNSDCFKDLCGFINTNKSKEIKKSFIEIDKLFKFYNKYIYQFNKKKINDITLIKNYNYTKNLHEFNEFIYICTTKQQSKENIFKIGRTNNLNSRLSGYNTGKTEDKKTFYCSYYKCTGAKTIESRLFYLLKNFKIDNVNEMYKLHYTSLNKIVNDICSNDNEVSKRINEFVKSEYESTLNLEYITF